DTRVQSIAKNLLADRGEILLANAAERARRSGDECREADLAHLELRDRERRLQHVLEACAARHDAVADELEDREAGEQRTVHVEERGDVAAGRSFEDLARELAIDHARNFSK